MMSELPAKSATMGGNGMPILPANIPVNDQARTTKDQWKFSSFLARHLRHHPKHSIPANSPFSLFNKQYLFHPNQKLLPKVFRKSPFVHYCAC